jgi:hypothetical protein
MTGKPAVETPYRSRNVTLDNSCSTKPGTPCRKPKPQLMCVKAFAMLLAIASVPLTERAVAAQSAPTTGASRVRIGYLPPKNPTHQTLLEFLKEHRALEKLQQLLTPYRLPRTLTVKMEGCAGESNAWYLDEAVTVCYEYMDDIWSNAPKATTAAGVTPIDAVLGPLYDVILHETAHALFDLLKIPVFGREEDAADQVSAYLMLQFGDAEARRLILGTAYAYRSDFKSSPPISSTDFSDEHGTPTQRFYNLLCIAYGADPELFADVVQKGYLPKERSESCEDEYQQVVFAFENLIAPHIDQTAAKRTTKQKLLPDGNARLPHRPNTPPSTRSN